MIRRLWRRSRTWQKVAVVSLFSALIVIGGAALYLGVTLIGAADSMYEALPERIAPIHSNLEPVEERPALKNGQDDKGKKAVEGMGKPKARIDWDYQPDVSQGEPFTLLLMGVDERENDRGRSDTLILLAVNPELGNVVMIHIPRDTRTELAGLKKYDKINHAYAFGGAAMTVATVEQLFEVPVHYYIKTNMEGFQGVIDELGGIEVHNLFPFEIEGHYFKAGNIQLNGEQSLAYVRMRKQDPKGDFGRMERQSDVLRSMANKVASMKGLANFRSIVDVLKLHTRMNLGFKDWLKLAVQLAPSIQHIEKSSVGGAAQLIQGIYYWNVSKEERRRIHELLLNTLEPKLDN